MKTKSILFLFFSLLILLSSCGSPTNSNPNAAIASVTVSAAGNRTSVQKGGTLQFSATVTGMNNPPSTVKWSIVSSGIRAGTTISTGGLLTVAANEDITPLTVRATSTFDTTKYGIYTVNVTPVSNAAVASVTVSAAGNRTSVDKGGSLQFSATVTGMNNPPSTVTWSIVSSGIKGGTTISTGGLLTVAANEDITPLTVRATSTFDTTKYGIYTVNVTPVSNAAVASVTVSAPRDSVQKGGTLQFSATVNGMNNPPTTVTWMIIDPGIRAGTTISSGGLLTVAVNEDITPITVRATSTFDPTKYGIYSVTVYDELPQ